jgi:uncharacterized protein YaiE (UPF0345 family)
MTFIAIKYRAIKLCAILAFGLISGPTLAAVHTISNSNFTVLDPTGAPVAIEYDVYGTFDDSMLCDDVTCTLFDGMTLASDTPFFGSYWTMHDIRVFTEGTYTFDTVEGEPLTMTVGPGQLGMHGLWDWLGYQDEDIVMVWDLFATFPETGSQIWNLASTDGNGDGIPGIPTVDGPIWGFNFNFNLNMDPPFYFSQVRITIDVIGGTTQECTDTGGTEVTLTADMTLFGGAELASIDWIIDSAADGSGDTITPFLPLGTHTIEALATTTTGDTDSDVVTVDVVDTAPPLVDVGFLDSRTGEPISEVSGSRAHFVTTAYSATDVCDPAPQSQGFVTPVFAVNNGDTIKIQGNNQDVQLPTSALELSSTATDASGNTASGQAILLITD